MPDREKYIEVLSKTAKAVKEFNEDTPIKISLECIEDILELLKEQEAPSKEELISHYGKMYKCKRCGLEWYQQTQKYCQECGTAVKWE